MAVEHLESISYLQLLSKNYYKLKKVQRELRKI